MPSRIFCMVLYRYGANELARQNATRFRRGCVHSNSIPRAAAIKRQTSHEQEEGKVKNTLTIRVPNVKANENLFLRVTLMQ